MGFEADFIRSGVVCRGAGAFEDLAEGEWEGYNEEEKEDLNFFHCGGAVLGFCFGVNL
jgi:hypothetical protein